MQKELASAIIVSTQMLSKSFDEVDELLRRIEDEDERRAFLRALGESMGKIISGIECPIFKAFPDLDPDKL